MIYERGHDIGNHSATHPQMTELSSEQCKEEVIEVHQIIYDLLGYEMNLFRPPYGAYDEKVLDAVSECEYYTIQWDVDSIHIKVKSGSEKVVEILCLK